MHVTAPESTVDIGHLRLNGVQRILDRAERHFAGESMAVSVASLADIRRRMAVVVPCKDEPLRLIGGVLGGIPPDVAVILVSNSRPERFPVEAATLRRVRARRGQVGVAVHQKDPRLADVLARAGLAAMIDDETGQLRNGKGEGMVVGIVHAHLAGSEYVGFVDADNHLPPSVTEYVDAFAVGFHQSSASETMVRIHWRSKPKMVDGALVPKLSGRVSTTTNRYLNRLLGLQLGREVGIVQTGNAGEHAMTLSLASRLHLSAGFSIETHQLVELLERFGTDDPSMLDELIEVVQLETRHPHIHLERDAEHLTRMKHVSLAAIHRSAATPATLRSEIEEELGNRPVPVPIVYPPIAQLDWELLRREITWRGTPSVPSTGEGALPGGPGG